MARAAAKPEDWQAIDADFRRACDTLSATLSCALAAHADTLSDALSVQARYIEAKHRDPFEGQAV